jgi:hypothetical protein
MVDVGLALTELKKAGLIKCVRHSFPIPPHEASSTVEE